MNRRFPNVYRFTFFMGCLCLMAGCSPARTGPLNDEDIRLLAVSGKYSMTLKTIHDQITYEVPENQVQTFNSLIFSLRPISTAVNENIDEENVDYVIHYQSGRNPLKIKVRISNNHLEYNIGNYLYTGGNVQDFEANAKLIMSESPPEKRKVVPIYLPEKSP